MGPRALRLLRRYLEWLNMVDQAGGYCGEPFCRDRGVTQGNPLLPTIFNVVVDTVVRHWESLLTEWEGGDSSDDDGDAAQTARRSGKETTANGGQRRDING